MKGDTGSGKTTQLVQYLLEEACHNGQDIRMVCCQPRRLTAVTVAERIAAERGEKVRVETEIFRTFLDELRIH